MRIIELYFSNEIRNLDSNSNTGNLGKTLYLPKPVQKLRLLQALAMLGNDKTIINRESELLEDDDILSPDGNSPSIRTTNNNDRIPERNRKGMDVERAGDIRILVVEDNEINKKVYIYYIILFSQSSLLSFLSSPTSPVDKLNRFILKSHSWWKSS